MKAVRTLMAVVVALTLGASVVAAQSLADVAKKEKKRRETNKEDATRVITDRELTYGYGGEPSTSSTVTLPGEEGAEGESEGEGSSDGGNASGEETEDEAQTREYWQGRVNTVKTKIAALEQQLRDGDWGDGVRPGVDPMGQNNLQNRQQVEQQLATARAELAGIQAEGRRAGVPPGWLR